MQRRGLADLQRVLTSDLPRVVSGVAIEAAWAAAHLVMYPWAWSPRPPPDAAAGTVSPG